MNVRPIVSVFIRPQNGEDGERLRAALAEIAAQDPTAKISADSANFFIAGMSEAHLESICDRIEVEYAISIDMSDPAVLYLETIRRAAEGEGKYIRQTGGAGNYGHCKLRIEPNERGKGNEFINDIKSGVLLEKYIRPIDNGVQGALEFGILAGYPIVDVKVTLYDGSFHETDSNEVAFKFAGSIALKEAAKKASPVVLEPMMAIEVGITEDMSDLVLEDINARRGRIEEVEGHGFQIVHAIVPLAELLSSSPQGRADYEMKFDRYEAVPDQGDADESGVTANHPKWPKSGRGAAAADLDFD